MMTTPAPEVTYVLPDLMGGVFSYVRNHLARRHPDRFEYAAVLTDNLISPATRSDAAFEHADRLVRFPYSSPPENLRAVLRRLARAIGVRPGVLVSNDWIELALATTHDTGRAVVAITHGDFDFYYDLAVRHANVIDAYITYTDRMANRLRELLPDRHDSIYLRHYGVDVPAEPRQAAPGPLRLIYAGRLARDKGVFDLPQLARELRERRCDVTWTLQGTGPDAGALRAEWPDDVPTQWTGMQPMAAVLEGYRRHDVLVMPSRNEGLPVALLEACAAGVVPVISNLPSGIPEIVEPGVTGFRPEVGDIRGFADAIGQLAADRPALERASRAVRACIARGYEAAACMAGYQQVYAEVAARPRQWKPQPLPYGSRLDQPWIPNAVTCAVRTAIRKSR